MAELNPSLPPCHPQSITPHRGLPDTGEGYTYPCFPRLRPERFGNVRRPRRLFKSPEQQRTVAFKCVAVCI